MERRAARREPSNADYDALFELSGTPTVELDAAGTVVRCNAAAARLLDTSPDAAVGRVLDDLLGADLTEALAADGPARLSATTKRGQVPLVMRSMRRELGASDGERFTVQLTRVPTASRDGPAPRGTALHWTAMDDISHNLGTPLSIVGGYAETLATRLDAMSGETIAQAAAAIHRHAARAIDELHAIQARIRLDSGGAGTLPASVLLAWLRRMLDANLVANNAVLVGAVHVDLITIDVAVARQALLNACSVALQSAAAPHVLRLSVRKVEEGTEFVLVVDPDDVAPTDEATNFTIAATRSLVQAGGGTYQPPSDGDLTQRIVLPTSAPATGGAAPAIPVAVIEDDEDTAALIRISLRNSSALFPVVVDERTFEAGLAAVARVQPRIVLLDQHLPDRIGTEGIAELQAVAPSARIVVLSARASAPHDGVADGTIWLEKGRVLADLGTELIGVLAQGD